MALNTIWSILITFTLNIIFWRIYLRMYFEITNYNYMHLFPCIYHQIIIFFKEMWTHSHLIPKILDKNILNICRGNNLIFVLKYPRFIILTTVTMSICCLIYCKLMEISSFTIIDSSFEVFKTINQLMLCT